MNTTAPIPELAGYVANTPHQLRGSITQCLVTSQKTGCQYQAQWLDRSTTTDAVFSSLQRQWEQSSRLVRGCLPQHKFVAKPDRIARLIQIPLGEAVDDGLFDKSSDLRSALRTAISFTQCLVDWHASSRIHGRLSETCIYRDERGQVQLREVESFEQQVQHKFASLPARSVIFFPPEASGSLTREISAATDLYAVGVLLFTMLTGRAPIQAQTASEYLERQLCVEPPRIRQLGINIPRSLDDVVARLLYRDPVDRYQTADGLLFDLLQLEKAIIADSKHTAFVIGTRDIRTTLTESVLVGRDSPIERAQRLVRFSTDGKPQVLSVSGSESDSRRRFLDEVALVACAEQSIVFRSGASSGNPKPLQSLELALVAIADYCAREPDFAKRIAATTSEHGATLSALLPTIAQLWPNSVTATAPAAAGQQRAAVALEELFVAFGQETNGIALIVDELDHCDDLTRTLVRSLFQRVSQRGDGLSILIASSSRLQPSYDMPPGTLQIELRPLTDSELNLHLRSTAGVLSSEISRSIAEVTDGDPTRASAILRRMIDVGAVQPSEQGWQESGPLSEALRSDVSIAELLERQVSALEPDTLRMVSAAAVLGQQFDLSILAHASKTSHARAVEVTSDLLRRRLLWRDTKPGSYRFANDQIHASLRQNVSPDQQRDLHRAAAEYLQANDSQNHFELAVHFDAAGDGAQALVSSLAAAKQARSQYSLSIAEVQFQIARRWVDQHDTVTRFQIAKELGEIQLLGGQYDECEQHLYEALALADTSLSRARIQHQIGELAFKRGRFSDAATAYENALAVTGLDVPANVVTMLGGLVGQAVRQVAHTIFPSWLVARCGTLTELDCLRLQLLSRLSHVYWFSRHKLWTLSNHLRSLNMAEQFESSTTLGAVYSEHGPVMSLLRWFKRANHYAERSFSIRQELGDVWGQGQSRHYHSVVKLAECRFHESIDYATRAVELLRRMGDYWEMNMARYQAANALYRVGRYDEATAMAKQMFECGREIGDQQATGISLDVWARTSPETLPVEIVSEEAMKPRPDAQSHAQTQLAYAIVLLHHDQIDESIDILREAIGRSERAGHLNTYISPCNAWLGTALRRKAEQTACHDGYRRQRRIIAAKKIIRKAVRIARGFPADRSHALRELGLVYAIDGRLDHAKRYFHKSVAQAAAHGQLFEEFESLRALNQLCQLNPSDMTLAESMETRLDELSERFDVPEGAPEISARSTNFSLADRFVTVLQSGRRIAKALSAEAVYSEASDAARRLLRGQTVDILRVDGRDDGIQFLPMNDATDRAAIFARIEANLSLIQAAQRDSQSVCDESLDFAIRGSAIAAPIAFRGSIVAVILVTHHELAGLFRDDELRIADFVSTLASAALENADGFMRLTQLNDTLEQRVQDRTEAAEQRAKQLAISNNQLRETEDQLREAIVHANAANEAKGRFLATISHEIRTPLNGILGMNALARRVSQDERQSNYLDTVQESGQSLLTLINDLLDFSKLESGKLELEQIQYSPRKIMGEVSRLMAASAWQKSVELVCDVNANVPATLTGDPSRLRQIIMNLVGNAIKFTENGFVAISLDLQRNNETDTSLAVSVRDSGIGIPADKIDKVFDSFSQADSSTTRRYGGTGLGLAICRELAEMMGGRIDVTSDVSVGSTFIVTLPVERAESDSELPSNSSPLSGRRIAVIDALEASREAIAASLKSAGAEIVQFERLDAWSHDSAGQYWDLAVLGCSDQIHPASWSRDDVHCLMLLQAETSLEFEAHETSGLLHKPAMAADIVDAAQRLLQDTGTQACQEGILSSSSDRLSRAKPAACANSVDAHAEFPDPKPARGRLLVAEDGEINQEVIVGILEMGGFSVDIANNGEEAVEKAIRGSYELCLMDVDMPKMDGIEATKLIRSSQECRELTIIAMTAHSSDQIWVTCQAAGMNGHLSKPLQPDTLFAMIEKHLGSAVAAAN